MVDKATREARIFLHRTFDRLWKEPHAIMAPPPPKPLPEPTPSGRYKTQSKVKVKQPVQSTDTKQVWARKQAYTWLRKVMGLPPHTTIGELDAEQCRKAMVVIKQHFPTTRCGWDLLDRDDL